MWNQLYRPFSSVSCFRFRQQRLNSSWFFPFFFPIMCFYSTMRCTKDSAPDIVDRALIHTSLPLNFSHWKRKLFKQHTLFNLPATVLSNFNIGDVFSDASAALEQFVCQELKWTFSGARANVSSWSTKLKNVQRHYFFRCIIFFTVEKQQKFIATTWKCRWKLGQSNLNPFNNGLWERKLEHPEKTHTQKARTCNFYTEMKTYEDIA